MQADRDFHDSGPQDCIWKIQPGTQNNTATFVFLRYCLLIICKSLFASDNMRASMKIKADAAPALPMVRHCATLM